MTLDTSFSAGSDEQKQAILRMILSLTRLFKFETVAEGVETVEEYEFLHQSGADMLQGYLFSPAVSIEEIGQSSVQSRPGGPRWRGTCPFYQRPPEGPARTVRSSSVPAPHRSLPARAGLQAFPYASVGLSGRRGQQNASDFDDCRNTILSRRP